MSHLIVSQGSERRGDTRVRIEMFCNQYVRERHQRALATNVSETGLLIKKLAEPVTRHTRVVGLEFELPGTGEIIWARAESRFDWIDEDFHVTGIHFVDMARKHERLLRDFVYDKQRRDMESRWWRYRWTSLSRPA